MVSNTWTPLEEFHGQTMTQHERRCAVYLKTRRISSHHWYGRRILQICRPTWIIKSSFKISTTGVAYCENSVQYVPPDGFFGIQIVQNSISAGAPPHSISPQRLRRLAPNVLSAVAPLQLCFDSGLPGVKVTFALRADPRVSATLRRHWSSMSLRNTRQQSAEARKSPAEFWSTAGLRTIHAIIQGSMVQANHAAYSSHILLVYKTRVCVRIRM